MKTKAEWDERYVNGELPWDTGRYDKALERVLARHSIDPGRALDVGCGVGTNAIWLAGRNFEVTGVDLSPVAIEQAKKRAESAGENVAFVAANILTDSAASGPFDFVFDRGCFHSFGDATERVACARAIHRRLSPMGYWFSMIGSCDGPAREEGPPQRSATEIVEAVEPLFEIVELKTTVFDSNQTVPARAWACLMRRREV